MLGNTFIKHRIFEVFEVWFFEKSGSRKSGSVGADFGDFAVRRAPCASFGNMDCTNFKVSKTDEQRWHRSWMFKSLKISGNI